MMTLQKSILVLLISTYASLLTMHQASAQQSPRQRRLLSGTGLTVYIYTPFTYTTLDVDPSGTVQAIFDELGEPYKSNQRFHLRSHDDLMSRRDAYLADIGISNEQSFQLIEESTDCGSLKRAFAATDVWEIMPNWTSDIDGFDDSCCQFPGIRCNPRTLRILDIMISVRENASGPIDFAQLPTSLENLHLMRNQFSGKVQLSHLPSLKRLDLSGNQFDGSCLPDLSNLPPTMFYLNLKQSGLSFDDAVRTDVEQKLVNVFW